MYFVPSRLPVSYIVSQVVCVFFHGTDSWDYVSEVNNPYAMMSFFSMFAKNTRLLHTNVGS